MEQAKRINGFQEIDDSQICYWYYDRAKWWYLYLPNCGVGSLGNHRVEEHEDGTITVSPSIKMTGHENGQRIERHGFLEHGVWREV